MFDQTPLLLLIKSFRDQQLAAEPFFHELTRLITAEVGCSRASLWLYSSPLLSEIECLSLFDAEKQQHFSGARLSEDDFAPYFETMRRDGEIVASNGFEHPATACFGSLYFEPNNIFSLLDVGIRINGQLVGVFCCEQLNDYMQWSAQQVAYLEQAGKLIAFALKPMLQERFGSMAG